MDRANRCKWDPDDRDGPCRAENPKKDEDTVYCRKHVTCTDYEMVDKETGEAITCDAAVANQEAAWNSTHSGSAHGH